MRSLEYGGSYFDHVKGWFLAQGPLGCTPRWKRCCSLCETASTKHAHSGGSCPSTIRIVSAPPLGRSRNACATTVSHYSFGKLLNVSSTRGVVYFEDLKVPNSRTLDMKPLIQPVRVQADLSAEIGAVATFLGLSLEKEALAEAGSTSAHM